MAAVCAYIQAREVFNRRLDCTPFAYHPPTELFDGLEIEIERLGRHSLRAVSEACQILLYLIRRNVRPRCEMAFGNDSPGSPVHCGHVLSSGALGKETLPEILLVVEDGRTCGGPHAGSPSVTFPSPWPAAYNTLSARRLHSRLRTCHNLLTPSCSNEIILPTSYTPSSQR